MTVASRRILLVSCALLVAVLASSARAATLESLIMPGPVIAGHAKYENECTRCHEPFSKAHQSKLCLGCHEAVAGDVKAKTGYHGRIPSISDAECKACHGEHKGRDADIVRLDPDTFDHRATDFPLVGAHGRAPCRDCHVVTARHREAPSECRVCHAGEDPHFGRMGPKCDDCHDVETWAKARFDHGKTRFSLIGRHRVASCDSCHPGARYKPTPTDCQSCHRLDDVHGGRYGATCDGCHTPEDWRKASFDHDRKTRFTLVGRHQAVLCTACHEGRLGAAKPAMACVACHRADDTHAGRNGRICEGCHSADGWKKASFDHNRDTKFKLLGQHAKAICVACHKRPVDQVKPGRTCDTCHGPDDVHRGWNGPACQTCHTVDGWKPATFDHGKATRFVLRCKHDKVACRACHIRPVNKQKPAQDCYACHRTDDVHKGKQGTLCARCHDERGWGQKVRFDHDLTNFPLIGLHAVVPCEACHLDATFKNSQSTCFGCHGKDDDHQGSLGKPCEACHNPNGWSLWRFDHNMQTRFALDGAHEGLACAACHDEPAEDRIALPSDCFACHREEDVHHGGFGRYCQRCHVTGSFREIRMAQ